MKHFYFKSAMILGTVLLLTTIAYSATTDRRVQVLHFGRLWWIPKVNMDPTLDITHVPATRYDLEDSEIKRQMRIYMPRNYESLAESYDVVFISSAGIRNFKSSWLNWFQDGVEDEGLGLLMTGGSESFGGRAEDPSWNPSPVGDTLPITFRYVTFDAHFFMLVKVVPVDYDDGMIKSLPWDEAPPFGYINLHCRPKQGATLVSTTDIPGRSKGQEPHLVTWSYGEGRSVAMTTPPLAFDHDWEYFPDLMINLLIYTFDGNPPTDYEVVHNLRLTLSTFQTAKSIATSLMEFADKMGANVREPELTLADANREVAVANDLYLDRMIQEAADKMEDARKVLELAEEQAIQARNSALAWVFLVEWLAVTGTCMLTGVVVYSLMIKRRMYREVSVTRSQR